MKSCDCEYILETKSIVKKFGGVVALSGVDLRVKKGEIRGLIGPNGSGKTTMFNVLTGYIPATEGTLMFEENPIDGLQTYQLSRLGIARTFQHIELFKGLSVLDNVMVASQCRAKSKPAGVIFNTPRIKKEECAFRENAEKALEFVGILKYKDYSASGLSYGTQRLVEIARALATNPRLLLLDEPAAGMNPTEKQNLAELIKKIRNSGITVILIDHDMKMVCFLADEITVLDCGRKIAEGKPSEIQNNKTVIEAYLGAGDASGIFVDRATAFASTSDNTVLSLSNVNTYYGAAHILKDINFDVKEGEFVALIGANGAGKTTMLKTISGMLKPRSGNIVYNGQDITASHDFQLVSQGMIHVPEGRGIFPQLSVKENILMGAYLRSDKDQIGKDYEYVLSLFPRLQERITQFGSSLSGGEQQMLAIARAMMGNPKLLLLDEPSMGLSPKFTEEVFKVISKIHADGHTIVLVEQNARAALSIADRAFVIEVGSIVLEGNALDLLEDPKVRSAYLGG